MASTRILIIDAERTTSRQISETLEKHGYEIKAAFDAEMALQIVNRWHPDLIILRPELPETDGYRFIRSLRARPATSLIPVIWLAGKKEVQSRLEGFGMGADDFLPPPIPVDELDRRVTDAIRKRSETERKIRTTGPSSGEWSVELTGFRGNLDQIGLPSLMSILEVERKTGLLVLILEGMKEKVRLEFKGGRVVRAYIDKRATPRNAELIYHLVGRNRGRFDFRPKTITSEDEIKTPTTSLLLEGARRIDETKMRESS